MHRFTPHSLSGTSDEDIQALLAAFHSLRGMWSGFQPPGPVRRSDFILLGTIAEAGQAGPVTVSGLAKAMRQSVPGVSRRVRELEESGYILRQKSSRDKRTATLALSPEGQALFEAGGRVFLARVRRVVDTLGPQKTHELLALLADLQRAVDDTQQQEEHNPHAETDTLC